MPFDPSPQISREHTWKSREKELRAPRSPPRRPPLPPPLSSPPLRHRVGGVTPAGVRGERCGRRKRRLVSVGLLGARRRRRPAVPGPMSVSLVVIRLELAEHSPLPAGFAYSAAGESRRAGPVLSHPGNWARVRGQPGPPWRGREPCSARRPQVPAEGVAVTVPVGPGSGGSAPTTPSQRLLFPAQLRRWLRRAPGRPRLLCPPVWRGKAPASGRPSSTSTWAAGR